jgi:hypothetical protein
MSPPVSGSRRIRQARHQREGKWQEDSAAILLDLYLDSEDGSDKNICRLSAGYTASCPSSQYSSFLLFLSNWPSDFFALRMNLALLTLQTLDGTLRWIFNLIIRPLDTGRQKQ